MSRIAICAPSTPITRDVAQRVAALAAAEFPQLELQFHAQCFVEDGHFAGSDAVRLAALLECANDPEIEAVWFARGGYGSNRIAEAAVRRSRAWLAGAGAGREPSLDARPTVAFNLMTLAMLCGTELMPVLAGHVVMVEEVAEHLYAVDRLFFHVTQHLRGIAGLRLGRISAVPENDRPFGCEAEDIARDWCARADIPFLGAADIGHDADNRIVPFGLARTPGRS